MVCIWRSYRYVYTQNGDSITRRRGYETIENNRADVMEKLTDFRFEGTDRIQAWCGVCKKWIEQVDVCLDCYPYDRDYIYCSHCNTAIAMSE